MAPFETGTSAALGKEHSLAGGVVRIGRQCSVVKSNGPNGLTIWGKVTDEADKFEILDKHENTADARTAQK